VIEKGDQTDEDLGQALAIMARHGSLESTRESALAHAARARAALAPLPESPLKGHLVDLADFVVARIV
jgi:octaprenyl-diphosphate synthase